MLNFFREYCASLNDDSRLMDILQAAARALPEASKERTQLSAQLGKMAEGQENAQKAVEQYKSVLRQDPDNAEAREALKRLYKQTQGYNALVELLRQELERRCIVPRLSAVRRVVGSERECVGVRVRKSL